MLEADARPDTGKELPRWNTNDPRHRPLKNYLEAYQLRRFGNGVPGYDNENQKMKVPLDPYEWWCKPSGNVVALAIMTTRNLKEADDVSRYETYIVNRSIRAGWFPWQYRDVQRRTPWILQTENITDEAGWTVWRKKEQRRRKREHYRASAQY